MDTNGIFQSGLTPNLIPNPPGEIPEAPGAGNAVANASPFLEAQDVDSIIKRLVLDRPLTLYIPNKEKYPDWEFRIINSIPQEIAAASNKGFREITDPDLVALFTDKIAGTDKDGKAFRPILMARPKAVGEVVRKKNRRELQGIYAGMDPGNKDFAGKYTENPGAQAGSKANFNGANWRIRIE